MDPNPESVVLDCGYETEQLFYQRIQSVAYHVRNNSAIIARRAWHQYSGSSIDLEYYKVLSESAVFLAFIELGGDVDAWGVFNWDSSPGSKLVAAASAHVRRDLQERGGEAHDIANRETVRKDAACVDQYRWDAWNPRAGEDRIEREAVVDALSRLVPDLYAVLRPQDVQLLMWKYMERLPAAAIGDRLGMRVGAVRTALSRATRAAEEALGERWYAVFREALVAA
jgi:hypothetical protein